MKMRCEFQGGAGLEEKFRPPAPCQGEFESKVSNRKFCEVCRPFAQKAQEHAHYQANRKKIAKKSRERYQPKGLLHAPRFTTKPRDCNVCRKPLPIPHPTSKRVCDGCKADPVRLEQQRQKHNEWDRTHRASRARLPKPRIVRTCQHREKKDGSICGLEFEPKPRIDNKGITRGVNANQVYCPKHQAQKAVSHRQVMNRDPKKESKRQKAYRKTPRADKLRERQRLKAAEIRKLAKEAEALRAAAKGAGSTPAPSPAKQRGRPVEEITKQRITKAARLERDGVKPWAMVDQLYPVPDPLPEGESAAKNKRKRFDAMREFLKRYRDGIDVEKQQLAVSS